MGLSSPGLTVSRRQTARMAGPGSEPRRLLWRRNRATGHVEITGHPADVVDGARGGLFGYLLRAAGSVHADIQASELARIVENVLAALAELPPADQDRVVNGAARCLEGDLQYDRLISSLQRAAVQAAWTNHLDEASGGVDLSGRFATDGLRSWVVIDPDGTVRGEGPDS